ncbi:MAG: hydrogenase 4 subunit B, partial [Nevskiales bacterium]
MPTDLLAAAALLWLAGAALALTGRCLGFVRLLLGLGGLTGIGAAVLALPNGTTATELPLRMAGEAFAFRVAPEALWLMGFGLVPATLACVLATPAKEGRAGWLFGAGVSLIGALGV